MLASGIASLPKVAWNSCHKQSKIGFYNTVTHFGSYATSYGTVLVAFYDLRVQGTISLYVVLVIRTVVAIESC